MTTGFTTTPAPAPTLRTRSAGELLDVAFLMYRRYFAPLTTIVLVCSLVPFALGAYLIATARNTWTDIALGAVYLVAMTVLGSIATGATVFVVSEGYLGRTITPGDAFRRTMPVLSRLVVCSLMLGFLVVIGLVLFVVPGAVLGCGLILAFPALVLEPGLTSSTALSRSWALTHGHKWRMFGLLLTAIVLIYIPALAVEGITMLVLPAAGNGAEASRDWVAPVMGSLVQLFLYPFLYCVLTTAYYDLRIRKEGFDLEVLASSLHSA